MSYFPLLSNPVRPKFQASYTLVPGNQVKTIPAYELGGPGRNRTAVQQLILGHAKILTCERSDDQSKHSI